jgi:rhodanese-related sulfurtransferase
MKFKRFIILLALLSMLVGSFPAFAQEAVAEDLVVRLDEYLTNELPPAWGNVSVEDLSLELMETSPMLIDVRTEGEWDADGYIEGATFISVTTIAQNLDLLPADLDTPIVVYCKAGTRGQFAMITLQVMGYGNVRNLSGGILAWKDAGFEVGATPLADMEFEVLGGPEVDAELVAAMDVFLNEAIPAGWGQVSVEDFAMQSMEAEYFLLDVRTPGEWENDGILEGATLVTINDLAKNLDLIPMDMPIMVYCKAGTRGNFGAIMLQMLGYEAYNLSGGILAWNEAGYDTVAGPVAFSMETRLDEYLTNELPPAWGNVSSGDLSAELMENAPVLIDVRTPGEWDADGHIEGAVFAPVTELMMHLDRLPADLDTPIVVYCKAGTRGQFAMITLQVFGYTDVRNLGGGIGGWIAEGFPVDTTLLADSEFASTGGAAFDTALVDTLDIFLTENIPGGWGQVSVEDYSLQSMETEYFLLDVRTPAEWAETGIIEGATMITINELGQHFDEIPMDMPIMVYCKAGTRGNFGAIMLQMLGYEAYNLSGGILAWEEAGYEFVVTE